MSAFLTPWVLIGGCLLAVGAAVATWLGRRRVPQLWRRATLFGFVVSAGAILLFTLFREPPAWCPTCLGSDWGWARLRDGYLGTEGLLNVALFVPASFFAVLLWRAPLRTTAIGAVTSLAIELVQPIIGVGVNDLTDLATNTAGTAIGASAAAAIMLVSDLATQKASLGHVARTIAGVLATAAMVFGFPWLALTQRQAGAVTELHRMFDGTTVADFQHHAAADDDDWLVKREDFVNQTGFPTEMAYTTASVARVRYTWNVYFAQGCVIAEWSQGFTTTTALGSACATPFHA